MNPHVPADIVLSELQARPILHACWERVIGFWNDLAKMTEGDMYHSIFMDNLKDAVAHNVHNWSHEVMTGFRRMGFNFPSDVMWLRKLMWRQY